MNDPGYDNQKVNRVLGGVSDFTEADFVDLAEAALDQAGEFVPEGGCVRRVQEIIEDRENGDALRAQLHEAIEALNVAACALGSCRPVLEADMKQLHRHCIGAGCNADGHLAIKEATAALAAIDAVLAKVKV